MWRFFFYAAPTISCRKGKSKAKSVNSKEFRVFDAVVFFNCCRQRGRMEVGCKRTPPLLNYTHLESALFRSMYGFSG